MAKSTRSKIKRHFRAKKREDSVYAVTEAARLHRLNQKLKAITEADKDVDVEAAVAEGNGEDEDQIIDDTVPTAQIGPGDLEGMELDSTTPASKDTKPISTHGPRESRREQWRLSKGLQVHGPRGQNRQGGIAAKRKAGRSHRRR